MLSLVIPSPKKLVKDIKMFLQLLVEYLHKIWTKGVQTYDAFDNITFNMRVIFMWIIHDFPTYGNISGTCVTKVLVGYLI